MTGGQNGSTMRKSAKEGRQNMGETKGLTVTLESVTPLFLETGHTLAHGGHK